MDAQIESLIAVGAAAAVNCRPCLAYHVPRCIKAGALESDVREAIKTGFRVNRGAHAEIRRYVEDVIADANEDCDDGPAAQTCCC